MAVCYHNYKSFIINIILTIIVNLHRYFVSIIISVPGISHRIIDVFKQKTANTEMLSSYT
jgi:hypothetical protein